jgi:hypothetical protein
MACPTPRCCTASEYVFAPNQDMCPFVYQGVFLKTLCQRHGYTLCTIKHQFFMQFKKQSVRQSQFSKLLTR